MSRNWRRICRIGKELKSYSDESSNSNNKDLNADLVTAKEIAKQVTWPFNYNDEHAQAPLLGLRDLPDNINET
jgi:hypothetical protein